MCYALLIVVGVRFNQSSYRVNETSGQVQIVVVLSSPLSFEVTTTIFDSDSYETAIGKLMVYCTKRCTYVARIKL